MLRIASLVWLVLALLLTACVQPTPTPESAATAAATDGSGYPAVEPTATAPAAYPALAEPEATATPGDYPAPSSRHQAPKQMSAVRLSVR